MLATCPVTHCSLSSVAGFQRLFCIAYFIFVLFFSIEGIPWIDTWIIHFHWVLRMKMFFNHLSIWNTRKRRRMSPRLLCSIMEELWFIFPQICGVFFSLLVDAYECECSMLVVDPFSVSIILCKCGYYFVHSVTLYSIRIKNIYTDKYYSYIYCKL